MIKHYCPECGKEISIDTSCKIRDENKVLITAHCDVEYPITGFCLEIDGDSEYLDTAVFDEIDEHINECLDYGFACPHCHAVLPERLIVQFLDDEDAEWISSQEQTNG